MPKVKKRLKNKFETKIVHGRCEGCLARYIISLSR